MALNDDIKNILADFGDKLVTDLRENLLRKENRPTKSKLSASIKYNDTVFKNGSYVMSISINDYYKYVDQGRGAGPVSQSGQKNIGEWGASRGYIGEFQKKNLQQRLEQQAKNKTNRKKKPLKKLAFDKARKQFIFLVARKLKQKGYKGNNFFGEVFDDGRVETLTQTLTQLLSKNVAIEIITQ